MNKWILAACVGSLLGSSWCVWRGENTRDLVRELAILYFNMKQTAIERDLKATHEGWQVIDPSASSFTIK